MNNFVYLIRHGESEGNANHAVYESVPDWAVPLTEKGKEDSYQLGMDMAKKLDQFRNANPIVFVSPFVRTQQTFEYWKHGWDDKNGFDITDIREESLLREQRWGKGSRRDVSQRTKYGTYFYEFENGESVADVDDRIATFLLLYNKLQFQRDVIIFAHGMTNRVLLKRLTNSTARELETWKTMKNAEYWKVNPYNGDFDWKQIKYYSDNGHFHWEQLKNP